jgi:hypothetical protein
MTAARALYPALEFSTGDFYGGTRTDYVAELNWRPSSHFYGLVAFEYDDVDLPEGSFVVRVIRARADVLFSPSLSWSNTVQYDNDSDNMGVNSRVRWEITPGNDVFFVLNQGFDVEGGERFRTTTSRFTVKVGLTFRF